MIKVAITGNIASGKSKVGEIISDLGYKVYDADKIVLVYCDDEIRKTRLMKRNNLTTEQAIARINSQKSQDEKINLVDYVIKNESTIEDLKIQVQKLF